MDNQSNSSNSGDTAGNAVGLSRTEISAPTHDVQPSSESLPRTGDNSSNTIRLFGVNIPVPSPDVTESPQSRQTISETMPIINASNPAPALPQVVVNEDVNAPDIGNEEEMVVDLIIGDSGGHELIIYGLTLQEFADFETMARTIMSRALTPTQIGQALNVTSYNGTGENNEACSICMEDLEQGEEVARLRCHHVFHTTCITQWLRIRNRCPNCNAEPYDFDW